MPAYFRTARGPGCSPEAPVARRLLTGEVALLDQHGRDALLGRRKQRANPGDAAADNHDIGASRQGGIRFDCDQLQRHDDSLPRWPSARCSGASGGATVRLHLKGKRSCDRRVIHVCALLARLLAAMQGSARAQGGGSPDRRRRAALVVSCCAAPAARSPAFRWWTAAAPCAGWTRITAERSRRRRWGMRTR